MITPLIGFVVFALGIVIVAMAPVVAAWLVVQALKTTGAVAGGAFRLLGGALRHVLRFVTGTIVDLLQLVGSVLTACLVLPMALANLGLLRLTAAKHYGAAVEDELLTSLACAYRIAIGHPIRLLGLGELTDGLERRLPELLEGEPTTGATLERRRAGQPGHGKQKNALPMFRGYDLVEELRAGGSGARLFVASPRSDKIEEWATRGQRPPAKVVIKAFDLGYGSTIPQIVRESRSLEAAKRLGLLLDHELGDEAFHYVMPFAPGVDLATETLELHAASGGAGLTGEQLRTVLGYARDLCDHLTRFHDEGLWHKDIKPSNLMVADGRLEVVDFGLVTPLESPLTLTTHGTEYFRDPELVRMAMAGRRVKDVDGVKFDLYSAGAVIFSVLENSFPAHGSLSSLSKPAPPALRWIVRRAMADIDKRYRSAEELGRDLEVLIAAEDPNDVKPADLPSVTGAAPPPRRLRVEAKTHAQDHQDVHRFTAFGLSAEVRGLGRTTRAFAAARDAHRARREEARRERHDARLARFEARRNAKALRRKRGRGVLKALCVLLVFGGIAGGVMEFSSARRVGVGHVTPDRDRESHVGVLNAVLEGTPAPVSAPPEAVLHSSVLERLSHLDPGDHVLLVADPSDAGIRPEVEQIASRLRGLQLEPVGFTGDEASTSPANVALLGAAILSLDQRPVGQTEGQCLKALLRASPEVKAVLYLSKAERGGGLRTILETMSSRDDELAGEEPSPSPAGLEGHRLPPQ